MNRLLPSCAVQIACEWKDGMYVHETNAIVLSVANRGEKREKGKSLFNEKSDVWKLEQEERASPKAERELENTHIQDE